MLLVAGSEGKDETAAEMVVAAEMEEVDGGTEGAMGERSERVFVGTAGDEGAGFNDGSGRNGAPVAMEIDRGAEDDGIAIFCCCCGC